MYKADPVATETGSYILWQILSNLYLPSTYRLAPLVHRPQVHPVNEEQSYSQNFASVVVLEYTLMIDILKQLFKLPYF